MPPSEDRPQYLDELLLRLQRNSLGEGGHDVVRPLGDGSPNRLGAAPQLRALSTAPLAASARLGLAL